MTRGSWATFLALALLATACTSPARWLEPKALDSIHPGTSTRAQVEQLLGEPMHRIHPESGAAGIESAIYRTGLIRQISEPGTQPSNAALRAECWSRTFSVVYGPEGIVQSQFLHESVLPVSTALGIERWGQPAPLSPARIDPASTPNKDACVQLLGDPFVEYLEADGRHVLIWIRGQQTQPHWSYQVNEVFSVRMNTNGTVLERHHGKSLPPWLEAIPNPQRSKAPLVQKQTQ